MKNMLRLAMPVLVAGDKAVKLIRREPDEMIMRMCAGWAPGFEAKRATALGFTAALRRAGLSIA